MTDFFEDCAKAKIHFLKAPAISHNDFMASNHSSVLGRKMDALAWTMHAIPMLLDETVLKVLSTYKAVEIPLDHNLQQRYRNMKTGSRAILSIPDALGRIKLDMTDGRQKAQRDLKALAHMTGTAEMLVLNVEQCEISTETPALID